MRAGKEKEASVANATAEWGAYSGWTGSRIVTGSRAALSLCEEMEANGDASRVLVGFTSEFGHFFAIGLGGEDSCAMYWDSVDPPYYQSRGKVPADDLIDYAYSGQQTELPGTVASHDLTPCEPSQSSWGRTGCRTAPLGTRPDSGRFVRCTVNRSEQVCVSRVRRTTTNGGLHEPTDTLGHCDAGRHAGRRVCLDGAKRREHRRNERRALVPGVWACDEPGGGDTGRHATRR